MTSPLDDATLAGMVHPGGPAPLPVLHVMPGASTHPVGAEDAGWLLPAPSRSVLLARSGADPERPRHAFAPRTGAGPVARLAAGACAWLAPGARRLRRALHERPAVVHCHSAATALSILRSSPSQRPPLAITFTGSDLGRALVSSLHLEDVQRVSRAARVVFVEAEWARRIVLSLGVPHHRIHRLPPAVDAAAVPAGGPRSADGRLAGPTLRLVAAGPLVERQGYSILLEAVSIVSARIPDVEVRILGEGPCGKALRHLSESSGLRGAVRWLGAPRLEQCLQELRRSDAFVSPSLTADDGDREAGLAPALRWAMAAALPIVATRHGAAGEVLRDGTSAYLIDDRDVAGLAAGLESVFAAPERARAMGVEARRLAEEDMRPARRSKAIQEGYLAAARARPELALHA